jgi:hypothetical protein
MAAFGNTACSVSASASGNCILKATAKPAGKGWEAPTISHRWVTLEMATN